MRVLVSIVLVLVSVLFNGYQPPALARPAEAVNLVGKWLVKFNLSRGGPENSLVFESQPKGLGSFTLLDTGKDNKAVAQPAVWAELTNARVSVSGHLELQLGTCCREIGTLIFKGNVSSNNLITGKLIFVTSVDEEESPYKFRSEIGTFTASRVP